MLVERVCPNGHYCTWTVIYIRSISYKELRLEYPRIKCFLDPNCGHKLRVTLMYVAGSVPVVPAGFPSTAGRICGVASGRRVIPRV